MSTAVVVTRMEHGPAELRASAAKSDDAAKARRQLAIAMVLQGTSRLDAARQAGMDRQTLRDWVHRYNETGLDPGTHKVIRRRCVDLRAEVARRFSVTVPERSISKWLRKLKLSRLQPRPHHPKADAAAREAFKKTSVRA